MVLKARARRMRGGVGAAAVVVAALLGVVGCLGTTPPQRLATATPIAVHVQLESSAGDAIGVPAVVVQELEATLAARNLQPTRVPGGVLGDARTSGERVAALLRGTEGAGGAGAPWVLLVEARARFFSQLSGRYRWEVELRTTLVARDRPESAQASDLAVAAFLLFEHEGAAEALTFVRRQLDDDVGALVDRVMATHSGP